MSIKERPFLRAAQLRFFKPNRDYFTFQTRDEEVARLKPLRAMQQTNPLHDDMQVCLFNGFFAPNYGNFHVIFKYETLARRAHPSNPPEFKINGVVTEEALGYTTTEELKLAGIRLF